MKFNKVSLTILALSGALMGCEVAGVTINNEKPVLPTETPVAKKEIKEGEDISPVFKNSKFVGNNWAYETAYGIDHIDYDDDGNYVAPNYPAEKIDNGSLEYLTFEKQPDGNLKVMLGMGDTKYESNNISFDDKGFVNIKFDNLGKIGEIHPHARFAAALCANNTSCGCGGPCPVSSESKESLTLGGNKTDLKYSDYGLWKVKTTTTYNDGHKETNTYVDPIIMGSRAGANFYDFYVKDPHVKFTGDTVAVAQTVAFDEFGEYSSSSEKDLTGTIELDFDNINGTTDLKLSYDNWKTFTGNLDSSLYSYTSLNGELSDNEGNVYDLNSNVVLSGNYKEGSYDENTGFKITSDSISNTEMVGTYTLNEEQNSKTNYTRTFIDGAFGAKTNDTINIEAQNRR